MRLLFIPGFGEDRAIFAALAALLPGEHVFIDNYRELGAAPQPALTALDYAAALIARHGITASNDVVIGHSMGGWIAHAVKHLAGPRIVQIASWTDPRKVWRPLPTPGMIYRAARSGLYLNAFNKHVLLRLQYHGKPSAAVFAAVFDNLRHSPKEYVVNQLRVILNPLPVPIHTEPDLRIHSRGDRLIRFPDEPVVEVPGDHFNLVTHAWAVAEPINGLLRSVMIGAAPSFTRNSS
jgi:pimeloyl-ACP methyl ester carboxylesterase